MRVVHVVNSSCSSAWRISRAGCGLCSRLTAALGCFICTWDAKDQNQEGWNPHCAH